MTEKSNAKVFIALYNEIDNALRKQNSLPKSLSFSDVIRRTVTMSSVVKKYENDLIDYSRLRNAIVHGGDDEHPIAEPNDEIVDSIKKIAELICNPPKLLQTNCCNKEVCTIRPNYTLKETILVIADKGYSNIPVYDNDELIGIANGQKIIDTIGFYIKQGKNVEEFISNTTINDVLMSNSLDSYYTIASKEITIDQVMNLFYDNRKLLVVLITENGTSLGAPLGVVTVSDIMDINNLMDNYDNKGEKLWKKNR